MVLLVAPTSESGVDSLTHTDGTPSLTSSQGCLGLSKGCQERDRAAECCRQVEQGVKASTGEGLRAIRGTVEGVKMVVLHTSLDPPPPPCIPADKQWEALNGHASKHGVFSLIMDVLRLGHMQPFLDAVL